MRYGPELPDWPSLPDCSSIECAALGAMLLRQDALDYGIRALHTGVIGSEWNRQLYRALARLHRRQATDPRLKAISPIEAAGEMVRMRKWKLPGEAFTFCHGCIDYCFVPENWRYYIDHCKETAQLRSMYAFGEFLDLGAMLKTRALQPDADPRQLIAAARATLDAIERDGCADINSIFERTK